MASAEPYIPPPGLLFRLQNKDSMRVLRSDDGAKPPVSLVEPDSRADDQWFSLLHGTGNRKGKYAIKGDESNMVLFNRADSQPKIGHNEGDGKYDENWNIFDHGKEQFAGWFRIVTSTLSGGNLLLVAGGNREKPYLDNYPTNTTTTAASTKPHQEPTPEVDVIKSNTLKWQFEAAKIVSTERKAVGDTRLKNNTDNDQWFTFNLKTEINVIGKPELTDGPSPQGDAKFTSNMPTITADNQIVPDSEQVEWSIGDAVTTNKPEPSKRNFDVDPQSVLRVLATAAVVQFEVPFEVHGLGKRGNTLAVSKGVWRGVVSGMDVQYETKNE